MINLEPTAPAQAISCQPGVPLHSLLTRPFQKLACGIHESGWVSAMDESRVSACRQFPAMGALQGSQKAFYRYASLHLYRPMTCDHPVIFKEGRPSRFNATGEHVAVHEGQDVHHAVKRVQRHHEGFAEIGLLGSLNDSWLDQAIQLSCLPELRHYLILIRVGSRTLTTPSSTDASPAIDLVALSNVFSNRSCGVHLNLGIAYSFSWLEAESLKYRLIRRILV